MISRIEGTLIAIANGRAQIDCGGLTYEVLVPAADESRLATMLDRPVNLHTLHYLEGQGGGSTFTPRLIGFATARDRAFFELFTTVKGMGNRKALRALALPFSSVASAIAERDVDLLKSLPEIGKRTAETIVAELNGKVDRFIELKPRHPGAAGTTKTGAEDSSAESEEDTARRAIIADAVAVLVQLGEPQLTARQLVERAIAADPTIDTAQGLVEAAYRLKQLA